MCEHVVYVYVCERERVREDGEEIERKTMKITNPLQLNKFYLQVQAHTKEHVVLVSTAVEKCRRAIRSSVADTIL